MEMSKSNGNGCELCETKDAIHDIFASRIPQLTDDDAIKDEEGAKHIIGIIAILDQEIAQLERRRLELLVAVGVYRNAKTLPVGKLVRRI
jgi:hypothetical protein